MTLALLATARTPDALDPFLPTAGQFALEVLCNFDDVSARVRESEDDERPAAIVVELHPDAIGPIGPVVRLLKKRFPDSPLVVACTDTATGRDLLHAARAGAEHFAYLPQDDLGSMLTDLTAPLARVLAMESEHPVLVAGLSRPVGRMFDAILRASTAPDSVAALAATIGVSLRTLDRRVARHGWPAPRQLLLWGRLVRGAAAVETAREDSRSALARLLTAGGFTSAERAAVAYARQANVSLASVLIGGVRAIEPALLENFKVAAVGGTAPFVSRVSAA